MSIDLGVIMRKTILAVFLGMSLVAQAYGQVVGASISGTVRDQPGRACQRLR